MILHEKPSETRKRHHKLEEKAHDLFISESAYRSEIAVVRVHHQGRLIELKAPLGWEEHEKQRGKRKPINHFLIKIPPGSACRGSAYQERCTAASVRPRHLSCDLAERTRGLERALERLLDGNQEPLSRAVGHVETRTAGAVGRPTSTL